MLQGGDACSDSEVEDGDQEHALPTEMSREEVLLRAVHESQFSKGLNVIKYHEVLKLTNIPGCRTIKSKKGKPSRIQVLKAEVPTRPKIVHSQ